MAERPSGVWRGQIAYEAAAIAAGTLEADEALMAKLFPESLLTSTDAALNVFDAELRWAQPPSDDAVFGVIERVIVDLNRINAEHNGAGYETGERELLCTYIDASLHEASVDVEALAAGRGIGRWEITDEWREW